jgi:RNA polymerase sigma factor (sigma-70 family)
MQTTVYADFRDNLPPKVQFPPTPDKAAFPRPPRYDNPMPDGDSTCWTTIRNAAAGDPLARDDFARRYEPVLRAYLTSRWQGSLLAAEIDDGVNQTFVELLRQNGGLERFDFQRPGGFRAFVYGIARNVARRFEDRRTSDAQRFGPSASLAEKSDDDSSLSVVFDRAWAVMIVHRARKLLTELAAAGDAAAQRRVEILRLRFEEGLPIRDVALRCQIDADLAHREYAKARREFEQAFRHVVAEEFGTTADLDRRCAEINALLG